MTIQELKEKYKDVVERGNLSPLSEVCTFCKHYKSKHTCTAFPQGIPEVIWVGVNNHRKPFAGDNGIQFELNPDISEEAIASLENEGLQLR